MPLTRPKQSQRRNRPSSTTPTLAEMVEQLKRHCGADGDNFSDVVHMAASQIGIDPEGKSLMELAMMCMHELGLPT